MADDQGKPAIAQILLAFRTAKPKDPPLKRENLGFGGGNLGG